MVFQCGKHRCKGGTIDFRKRADYQLRGHHDRAGIARAHQCLSLSVAHQLGGDADGAVLLASNSDSHRVIHGYDLLRVDYLNARGSPRAAGAAEGPVPAMFIEFRLNLLGSPHKDHADAQVARSFYGSLDLAGWSIIATHCVHSDLKHK